MMRLGVTDDCVCVCDDVTDHVCVVLEFDMLACVLLAGVSWICFVIHMEWWYIHIDTGWWQ